ncbi:hypothetical protein V6Z11_D01G178300 [Gossypium hirsutum]
MIMPMRFNCLNCCNVMVGKFGYCLRDRNTKLSISRYPSDIFLSLDTIFGITIPRYGYRNTALSH